MDIQEQVMAIVNEIDKVNAEFILNDNQLKSDIEMAFRFQTKDDSHMVTAVLRDIKKYISEYGQRFLTPANIQVGDGVTMHLYSDAHAGTVVKKTKTTVTVQRDIATLDPNFKPEIVPGGFAGHCTNQNDQKYTYEKDPNGELVVFRWSTKRNRFMHKDQLLTKGRREFYDYNF